MVKLINMLTGNAMWVAEDRVEEYLAKGHKRPVAPTVPKKPVKKGRSKK